MSLLFHLPFIICVGMFEVARDEMRMPGKVINGPRRLDNDRTR
jgi:hypothetical protein